jgi:hypothetical protein
LRCKSKRHLEGGVFNRNLVASSNTAFNIDHAADALFFDIWKRKQVQASEQEQSKRQQWRISYPWGRLAIYPCRKIGGDSQRKDNGYPTVKFPDPDVPW